MHKRQPDGTSRKQFQPHTPHSRSTNGLPVESTDERSSPGDQLKGSEADGHRKDRANHRDRTDRRVHSNARAGTGMSVPDAIAPEVGYRTWAAGLGQLWSVHGPTRVRWPRSEPLRATCLRHPPVHPFAARPSGHPAPDGGCTCGIYGAFDPWNVDISTPRGPWTLVVGRVEGWGRVALAPRGFRAEFARPVQLFAEPWWSKSTSRSVTGIAAAYGIPIVLERAWSPLMSEPCQ